MGLAEEIRALPLFKGSVKTDGKLNLDKCITCVEKLEMWFQICNQ